MLAHIQEDIFKITVPIPFPLRDVNMYALVGPDGWALIDSGMGTPDARQAFTEGLQEAGLSISTLRAIVLSHHHPDHVGLSGELHEQSGAPVYMHPIDEKAVQLLWSGMMPRRFGRVSQFFLQHGLPQTELWLTRVEPEEARKILSVPPHDAITLVEDGDEIDLVGHHYRVIWTPGHSDGHICLFRERDGIFIAADHILPRITPNIGLYSDQDRPNPLGDYLDSLEKVADLPASIVLPGHGDPLHDLAGRAQELIEHHEERELHILSFLKERPQNAYQIMEQLFPSQRLSNHEAKRMAVAEVISHLEYMRYNGQIQCHRTDDGFIIYEAIQP